MEGGTQMTKIPSDEAFARAKRQMGDDSRGLDAVSRAVNGRFQDEPWFHRVYVLPQRDVEFRAYVFFRSDAELQSPESKVWRARIENAVREELERNGRGERDKVTVAFEYDSDENVDKHFDGDYLYRLR